MLLISWKQFSFSGLNKFIFRLIDKSNPVNRRQVFTLDIASSNSTIVSSPSPITTTSAPVFRRKYSGSGDGRGRPLYKMGVVLIYLWPPRFSEVFGTDNTRLLLQYQQHQTFDCPVS